MITCKSLDELSYRNTFNIGRRNIIHPFKESNLDFFYGPYYADSEFISYYDSKDSRIDLELRLDNINDESLLIGYKSIEGRYGEAFERSYILTYVILFKIYGIADLGRTVGILDDRGNLYEFWITTYNNMLVLTQKYVNYSEETIKNLLSSSIHMLSFDTNGGSFIPAKIIIGSQSVIIPNSTRDNYTLDSVTYNDKNYKVGDSITVNSDGCIKYNWLINKKNCKVTIKVNNSEYGYVRVGGSTSVNGILTLDVLEGNSITIEAIPNEGYLFYNWSNNNTSTKITYTITSDTTIVATFKSNLDNTIVYYVDADYIDFNSDGFNEYQDSINRSIENLPSNSKISKKYVYGDTIIKPDIGSLVIDNGTISFDGYSNDYINRSLYLILPSSNTIESAKYYDNVSNRYNNLIVNRLYSYSSYDIIQVYLSSMSALGGSTKVYVKII